MPADGHLDSGIPDGDAVDLEAECGEEPRVPAAWSMGTILDANARRQSEELLASLGLSTTGSSSSGRCAQPSESHRWRSASVRPLDHGCSAGARIRRSPNGVRHEGQLRPAVGRSRRPRHPGDARSRRRRAPRPRRPSLPVGCTTRDRGAVCAAAEPTRVPRSPCRALAGGRPHDPLWCSGARRTWKGVQNSTTRGQDNG